VSFPKCLNRIVLHGELVLHGPSAKGTGITMGLQYLSSASYYLHCHAISKTQYMSM
jgi:hypothetical protein